MSQPVGFQPPPSLVDFAADAVRRMILDGSLAPGERLPEIGLAERLGISRPPLREALRLLAREGLVLQQPRRGASVMPLTLQDVFEIFTLRRGYEELAIDLGIPEVSSAAMQRSRDAMTALEDAARAGGQLEWTERAFDFHVSLVALAGNGRLEAAYSTLRFQMQLCMAMNREARVARVAEDAEADIARHRHLLDLAEAGDADGLRAALATHGDRTFLVGIEDRLEGHTPDALAWLHAAREEAGL